MSQQESTTSLRGGLQDICLPYIRTTQRGYDLGLKRSYAWRNRIRTELLNRSIFDPSTPLLCSFNGYTAQGHVLKTNLNIIIGPFP